jgi:predicted DsbA family dithiol-disulfide isomerase
MLSMERVTLGLIVILSLVLGDRPAFAGAEPKPEGSDGSQKKKVSITKVYDFACPWCYVGKRRMDRAKAERSNLDFSVIWQPYQLNPNMPREGRNRWDYYRNKFGAERAKKILAKHKKVGAVEGIAFCDLPEAMAPNTLSAHTLMYWGAQDQSVDTDMLAEKLYYSHHVACENIGDHDVLVRIAGEVGMNKTEVARKLTDRDDEERIKQQIRQSKAKGITGVPYFVINEQYGLKGAQPVKKLIDVFDEVTKAP